MLRPHSITMAIETRGRKKWYQIQWYADVDTAEDRRLINKLDLLIVPYAVLSYWVKYLDQSNLSKFGDRLTYTEKDKLTYHIRQCVRCRLERGPGLQGQ